MEIKVNVETNAEEREDVELFEQERRKEEEFKNKLEEQIDSLISQNEKEKSRIEDEIRKLEIELKNKICELDEENKKLEEMKEHPYFYTDRFSEYDETLKQNHDEYMTAMTKKNDYLSQHFSKKDYSDFESEFYFKIFKAIRPYVYTLSRRDMGKYDAWCEDIKHEVYSECPIEFPLPEDFEFEVYFSELEMTWFLKENKRFFRDVKDCDLSFDERIDILTKLVKSKIEGRFERLILHLTLTKCENPNSVWNIRPYNNLFDEFEKRYQEEGW